MRKILISTVIAIGVLNLFTCSSTKDISGDGGNIYIDYDPVIYFRENSFPSRRAAVITFKSMDGAITFFDAFVTDEVIRKLSNVRNLKLVDRNSIDLIMHEHALAQSGIVSSVDAVELGKLLTVDHIITGTYSYKENTIFVRGRILDAVTGKIQKPFGFRIPYSGVKKTTPTDDNIDADRGCEDIQKPVIIALRDLTNPAAVSNAVERAVEVPWKKPCGNIHRRVISEFAYSKLYPQKYHEFLAATLEAMENPGQDYYTVREIFSYFARDGRITEFEWSAGREIMKRGWHPFYLKYFFKTDKYNMTVMRRRALELLGLARENKIGRPYALPEHKVGRDILTHALSRNTEKGIDLSLFIVRSMNNPAGAEPKIAGEFFNIITACYKDTLVPESRRESVDILVSFLKSRKADDKYADKLWSFLYNIDKSIHSKKKRDKYIPFLEYDPEDLKKINSELVEYLCLRKKTAAGSYSEKEIQDYFRRYGVKCSSEDESLTRPKQKTLCKATKDIKRRNLTQINTDRRR